MSAAEMQEPSDHRTIQKKNILGNVIAEVFKRFQTTETSSMLDRMKNLGFKYSTRAGITVGIADIIVLPDKQEILDEAQDKVDRVMKQYRRGLITEEERYDRVIKSGVMRRMKFSLRLMKSLDRFNSIFMMSDSNARGNKSQLYAAWRYAWSDGRLHLVGSSSCQSNRTSVKV